MVNVGGVWMEKFPEGWKERTEKRISEILDRYFATHEDEFWKLVEKGVLTLVPYHTIVGFQYTDDMIPFSASYVGM